MGTEGFLKPNTRNTDIWMCDLRPVAGRNYEPSPEDRQAAACYTTDGLRSRFLVSRWMLRSILREYVGAPAALRFRKGRYGKSLS